MTKNNPITLRLPDPLRAELEEYLRVNDRPLSRFVRAAIVEKLRRERPPVPRPASPMPT